MPLVPGRCFVGELKITLGCKWDGAICNPTRLMWSTGTLSITMTNTMASLARHRRWDQSNGVMNENKVKCKLGGQNSDLACDEAGARPPFGAVSPSRGYEGSDLVLSGPQPAIPLHCNRLDALRERRASRLCAGTAMHAVCVPASTADLGQTSDCENGR